MADTFCWAPWIGLALRPNGAIKPCCTYSGNLGTYRSQEDLQHAVAHPKLRKMKEDFLAGRAPEGCGSCYANEKNGRVSKRMKIARTVERQGWKPQLHAEPASLPELPYLELGFSNLCNLTCVMCNSESSSSWRKHEESFAEASGTVRAPKQNLFQVSVDDIPELVEAARSAKHINLLGGEPFVDPRYRTFLAELAKVNPSCDITITTNGTHFDEEAFAILNRFEKGAVDFSVDGVGRIYEYVRGASFEKFEENFRRACGLRRSILVSSHFTLSLFNALQLPELIRWAQRMADEYAPRKVRLYLDQIVHTPSQMTPGILPKDLLIEVHRRLLEVKNFSCVNAGDVEKILNFLSESKTKQNDLEAARKSAAYFNRLRGFKIWEAEPRLGFLEG